MLIVAESPCFQLAYLCLIMGLKIGNVFTAGIAVFAFKSDIAFKEGSDSVRMRLSLTLFAFVMEIKMKSDFLCLFY